MKKKWVAGILSALLIVTSFSGGTSVVFAGTNVEKGKLKGIVNTASKNPVVARLLAQAGDKYKSDSKIKLIVEINDKVMAEKYGLKVPDISKIRTEEGMADQLEYAEKAHKYLKKAFDNANIDYKISEYYDTLLLGAAVSTDFSDALKIAALPEVVSVQIDKIIPRPVLDKINLIKPLDAYSNEMVQAGKAWSSQYSGKGQLIAIIDSGADPEHEVFKSINMEGAKFPNEASVKKVIDQNNISKGKYFSEKIPFGFNYADRSERIKERSVKSHGQHVAGIIAANSSKLKGVAPDAQLAILRVFSDSGMFGGGTSASIYNKAIDDAVKMGADSINMSLGGTGTSDSRVEEDTKSLLKDARDAGIVISIAAGNDGYMGWGATTGPKASNPDYGILSSPSIAELAMSVASVNNSHMRAKAMIMTVGGKETKTTFVPSEKSVLSETDIAIVDCGLGYEEDFKNKNLAGKYALIKRGHAQGKSEDFGFKDKIQNAENAGAKGAIVYNHIKNEAPFIMAGLEDITIPSCLISNDDGEFLKSKIAEGVKVRFDKDYHFVTNPEKYQVSNFSSWGMTPEGNLKPDISAPGGKIYSSLNDNTYDVMDGTSMAAPHVAGGIAIVKQYVEKNITTSGNAEKYKLIKNLLMSTATPHKNGETNAYTSPRSQGAGLMSLDNAINSKVIVEGTNNVASMNLRNISGNTVTVSGKLHNYGSTKASYEYYAVLNTDSVENGKILLKPKQLMETSNDKKSIDVEPGSTADFSITMTLGDAEIKQLEKDMPNGFFLEGYVFFKSTNGMQTLNAPYVGFRGNWSKLPVIEDSIYDMVARQERPYYYDKTDETTNPFTHIGTYIGSTEVVLGELEGSTKENPKYDKTKIAFSPNGDGVGDTANFVGTFLKNYKNFEMNVYRAEDTTYQDSLCQIKYKDDFGMKNFFVTNPFANPNYTTSKPYWKWDGRDSNGETVQDGKYKIVVHAEADGGDAEGQTMEFPVTLDCKYPRIVKGEYEQSTGTFKISEIEENGSGIRSVNVILKGKIIENSGTGSEYIFKLPENTDAKDAELVVMDHALNRVKMPLDKAIRTGKEHAVIIKPTLASGVMSSDKFNWQITDPTGATIEDPYNLTVGEHILVITNVHDDYEVKGNNRIHFTIGEDEYNKVIEVPFKYKNKREVTVVTENVDKASLRIVLLDKKTGGEFELKKHPGGTNYAGAVPDGEYKVQVKDLKEGYIAYFTNYDSITVHKDMSYAIFPNLKVIEKKEKDVTVKLVRNGYTGSATAVFIGKDIDKTTYKIKFEAGESSKTVKIVSKLPMEAFATNLEGTEYGGEKRDCEVSGRPPYVVKITVKKGAGSIGIPVDKENLFYKISHAKSLNEDEFLEGWDNMKRFLKEAERVYNDPAATQEEVNKAYQDLKEAIDEMVKVVGGDKVDKTQLLKKIKEAEELYNSIDPAVYTEQSVEYLQICIEAAKVVMVSKDPKLNTPEHIKKMIDRVDAAMKGLIRRDGKVDKSKLDKALKKAVEIQKHKDEYTEDSIQPLIEAIEYAKDIFEDDNASRQSIDWATELLERKIGELVRKNPLPEPKIDLDSAINKAEAADRKGKTAEDVLKLDMAINLAKVLSADAKTSKEALAIAKTELENAVENMRAKPENNEILHGMLCFIRNNVDVEKDSVEIKGNIYKGSVVRIDKSEVSTATFNALKDKFEEALTLLQKADATKENIDKAAGELKAAYDNLALNSGVSKIKPELNNSNALEGAINNIEEVDFGKADMINDIKDVFDSLNETEKGAIKNGNVLNEAVKSLVKVEMKKKIKVVKDRYDLLPKIDEAKKEDLSKAEIVKAGFTVLGAAGQAMFADEIGKVDAIIAKLRGSVPNPGTNPGGSGGGAFVPGPGASPADKDKIKDNKDKSDKNDRKDLVKADINGYIKGFADNTFRPGASITRAEVAAMIYRLVDTGKEEVKPSGFKDINSNSWYADAVALLKQKGIISGMEDGMFHGDKEITRAEFVKFIVGIKGIEGKDSAFKDVTSGHWAFKYVGAAADKGWVKGISSDTFAPERKITRAEAVVIINRVLGKTPDADPAKYKSPFTDVKSGFWAYSDIVMATAK